MNATEMVAGRALDAEIAEKLFGFEWWVSGETGRRAIFDDEHRPYWFTHRAKGDESLCAGHDLTVPNYSTDIAASFLVVEKMAAHENRYLLALECDHALDGSLVWTAQFCSERACAGEYVRAATAPLAICRAALSAIGAS